MDFKKRVEDLLDKALKERPDIFLLEFSISDTNDVKIVVDGDNGVSINELVAISREIEHNLDRDEEDFSLTVSSVDITKPFYLKRQFRKNLNRPVKVKTSTGEEEGLLVNVEEDRIVLENKVREPKKTGKGKVTVIKHKDIPFDEIKEAKVVIKF